MLLWLKAFHIIAMVTWFAGIFYLPRLFVYHTQAKTDDSYKRFCVMERKLYYAIMTPSAYVTVALGFWMIYELGTEWFLASYWLHAKLALVIVLIGFHLYCGKLMKNFANHSNHKSEKFFRMINEIPVIPLVGIIILAVVKPFMG
jgi:putative membrane protein